MTKSELKPSTTFEVKPEPSIMKGSDQNSAIQNSDQNFEIPTQTFKGDIFPYLPKSEAPLKLP